LLPPKISFAKLIKEIGDTREQLGNLSGSLIHPVINPRLLVSPLLTKEAVLSSSIEGTIATLEEVYRFEVEEDSIEDEVVRRDAREIVNYRMALEESLKELKNRAIGENLLKKAHYILLDSVRGAEKDRGHFRREQVFIGKPGSSIEEATFIPAAPEKIQGLMSNWERYINDPSVKDPLVQIAVAHYQFEAIHPFLDGNGRIGRLIIPLFLCDRKLLPHPLLYVSEYFNDNRNSYIDALRGVDTGSNWTEWVRFFLLAVRTQAIKTQAAVIDIAKLFERMKTKVASMGSVYGTQLLEFIFLRPIVNFAMLKGEVGGASAQTIYNLLGKFEDEEILLQIPGRKRNRMYVFTELLQMIR
jgi:Fic family protein